MTAPASETQPAVRLSEVHKRFGDVVALDGASVDFAYGEIHALLGENGAGKTSLMNVLAGVYRADSGSVEMDGHPVAIHSPDDAKRHQVGMVHQEQRLVGRFTAPENVSLGHREPRWITLQRYFRELARRLSERYRLPIDPENPVWSLPLGRRQRVELVKLLHHGAKVIVLDEPTANLAPAEVETFFHAMRELAEQGRAVVFITHKLDEVLRYTDRVTIMRSGRVLATFATHDTNRLELNRMMVGDPQDGDASSVEARPGEVVLDVRGFTMDDPTQRVNPRDVTLQVRSGEVVSVAGVAGNGQRGLAEAITGHVHPYAGTISVGGVEVQSLRPRQVAERLGVAYIPEDRKDVGLIAGQSVAINLALRRYDRPPLSRGGWLIDYAAIRAEARRLIDRYGIRPPDPDVPAGRLSGGNQQRVIIARELSGTPRLIVADNFTRGLDPRSTRQFTDELFAAVRERGAGALWITGDLSEALSCDRIAVMNSGRIVAVLERSEATRERVGLLMSGNLDDADTRLSMERAEAPEEVA